MTNKTKRGAPWAFVQSALIAETDDCILWPFAKGDYGHGYFHRNKKKVWAHRYILIESAGLPPIENLECAHDPRVCQSASCINKRHLRWATSKANGQDMIVAGTSLRGTKQPMSKLSDYDVIRIFHSGQIQRELAEHYGVSRQTISDIQRGKSWSWLTSTIGLELGGLPALLPTKQKEK